MRRVLEFATNLPCLMALTAGEVRSRLEGELRCRPAKFQEQGGVISGWGGMVELEDPRTGSAFHTHDARAVILDVGPGAEYVLDQVVMNVQCPSREEYRRLFLLQDDEVLQHYHQDPSFRVWVDHCAAHGESLISQGTVGQIFWSVREWLKKKFGRGIV